jgi:hypothetical protein
MRNYPVIRYGGSIMRSSLNRCVHGSLSSCSASEWQCSKTTKLRLLGQRGDVGGWREVNVVVEYLRCKNKIMKECISWQYKKIIFFRRNIQSHFNGNNHNHHKKKKTNALCVQRTQPKPTLIE